MILARIDGNVTTSIRDASLVGQIIVLCTPIDENGADAGDPIAAIDPIGAGQHALVFITTDGPWTQKTVGDDRSPVRNQVIGIVDAL
jgi:ethanolamine utilization protein EutN